MAKKVPVAIKPRCTPPEVYEAITTEQKKGSVRALDMSLNELVSMWQEGDLHISPEYQRLFRWNRVKESQLIESILLEMPIPPIYVVETYVEGMQRWELIDGLQRISTYIHLVGMQAMLGLENLTDPLVLTGCDIVAQLNGCSFKDFPTALQQRVRRFPLRVQIIRRDESPKFAFYMFKRLNQGGEPLSDQEARNCSIRLIGPKFCDFIHRLATQDADFQECVSQITDDYRDQMGRDELVLKFFAFKNAMDDYVHDIEPFLTEYMRAVTDVGDEKSEPFDYATENLVFRATFRLISEAVGSDAFRRWEDGKKQQYGGGFNMAQYEAVAIGVAMAIQNKNRVDDLADPARAIDSGLRSNVGTVVHEAKQSGDMKGWTVGGGKNFRRVYVKKIDLIRIAVEAVL